MNVHQRGGTAGTELERAYLRYWFVRIRTPWTLSDDRVRARTQRVAGYLFVGAGALFLLASAPLARWTSVVAGGATIGAALAAVVYSALRSTRA